MDQLTDNEKQLLAREVAADNHDRVWPITTSYGDIPRKAFYAGWDAAMEYVNARKAQQSSESD